MLSACDSSAKDRGKQNTHPRLRGAHVKCIRSLTCPVFRALWIPDCQVNNCASVHSSYIINIDTIWSKCLHILCQVCSTTRGKRLNTFLGKSKCFITKMSRTALRLTPSLIRCVLRSFPGAIAAGVHLAPRLRCSRAIFLLSLHAFMARRRKTVF